MRRAELEPESRRAQLLLDLAGRLPCKQPGHVLSCQRPQRHALGVVASCDNHVVQGMQPPHQG